MKKRRQSSSLGERDLSNAAKMSKNGLKKSKFRAGGGKIN